MQMTPEQCERLRKWLHYMISIHTNKFVTEQHIKKEAEAFLAFKEAVGAGEQE